MPEKLKNPDTEVNPELYERAKQSITGKTGHQIGIDLLRLELTPDSRNMSRLDLINIMDKLELEGYVGPMQEGGFHEVLNGGGSSSSREVGKTAIAAEPAANSDPLSQLPPEVRYIVGDEITKLYDASSAIVVLQKQYANIDFKNNPNYVQTYVEEFFKYIGDMASALDVLDQYKNFIEHDYWIAMEEIINARREYFSEMTVEVNKKLAENGQPPIDLPSQAQSHESLVDGVNKLSYLQVHLDVSGNENNESVKFLTKTEPWHGVNDDNTPKYIANHLIKHKTPGKAIYSANSQVWNGQERLGGGNEVSQPSQYDVMLEAERKDLHDGVTRTYYYLDLTKQNGQPTNKVPGEGYPFIFSDGTTKYFDSDNIVVTEEFYKSKGKVGYAVLAGDGHAPPKGQKAQWDWGNRRYKTAEEVEEAPPLQAQPQSIVEQVAASRPKPLDIRFRSDDGRFEVFRNPEDVKMSQELSNRILHEVAYDNERKQERAVFLFSSDGGRTITDISPVTMEGEPGSVEPDEKAAKKYARENNLRIVGYVHSHPDGLIGNRLSSGRDNQMTARVRDRYSDYVIAPLGGGGGDIERLNQTFLNLATTPERFSDEKGYFYMPIVVRPRSGAPPEMHFYLITKERKYNPDNPQIDIEKLDNYIGAHQEKPSEFINGVNALVEELNRVKANGSSLGKQIAAKMLEALNRLTLSGDNAIKNIDDVRASFQQQLQGITDKKEQWHIAQAMERALLTKPFGSLDINNIMSVESGVNKGIFVYDDKDLIPVYSKILEGSGYEINEDNVADAMTWLRVLEKLKSQYDAAGENDDLAYYATVNGRKKRSFEGYVNAWKQNVGKNLSEEGDGKATRVRENATETDLSEDYSREVERQRQLLVSNMLKVPCNIMVNKKENKIYVHKMIAGKNEKVDITDLFVSGMSGRKKYPDADGRADKPFKIQRVQFGSYGVTIQIKYNDSAIPISVGLERFGRWASGGESGDNPESQRLFMVDLPSDYSIRKLELSTEELRMPRPEDRVVSRISKGLGSRIQMDDWEYSLRLFKEAYLLGEKVNMIEKDEKGHSKLVYTRVPYKMSFSDYVDDSVKDFLKELDRGKSSTKS